MAALQKGLAAAPIGQPLKASEVPVLLETTAPTADRPAAQK